MKIKIDQDKCIACGTCAAVCPLFIMGESNKAILKGSASPDKDELEIEQSPCAKEAAEMCPVECIKIDSL